MKTKTTKTTKVREQLIGVVLPAVVGLALAGLGAWAVACPRKPAPDPGSSGLAPPADRTAATPAAPADPCAAICARSTELGCPRAALCAESCRQMREVTICGPEMARVLGCMAREPAAGWECGPDGEAMIKEGRCDAEQEGFTVCARSHAAAGP
jgi:hypothetical protein